MSSEHLHVVDYPQTIKILTELLARRNLSGFVQSPSGIDVDWCTLKQCGLSTTEKATLEIAHGICVVERCGGFPGDGSVARTIADAVKQLR